MTFFNLIKKHLMSHGFTAAQAKAVIATAHADEDTMKFSQWWTTDIEHLRAKHGDAAILLIKDSIVAIANKWAATFAPTITIP